MTCIFVDQPKECLSCLDARKLQCLRNHLHLKVSEDGRKELHALLDEECITSRRYKEKSGQAGRRNVTIDDDPVQGGRL